MPILKEIGSGLGMVFAGLALIATVFGVYMLFTLWDSATHGDRENREQAAAAALSCPQKKVRISGEHSRNESEPGEHHSPSAPNLFQHWHSASQ